MPPKITINGKEVDIANLPPEFKNLAAMSPELKELMADKDGNGVPDIVDNPFAMLGKLGQLSSIAKDMPVLMSTIKNPAEKKDLADFVAEEIRQVAASQGQKAATGALMGTSKKAPSLRPKIPAQYFASATPPVKKDTGRMVLFWMAILGVTGWYVWQYYLK